MKRSLGQERTTLTPWGWLPRCGLCDKPITGWKSEYGADMHEAFITRGDIHGREDMTPRIMVRENCALVHHGECHQMSATKAGQLVIATHIAYWVGIDAIMDWLDCLEDDFVGTTIQEAKSLVQEISNGRTEN